MRLLYVFPHPDDESFGPAPAMARQRRLGHEVHLLTLTRGGATSQRKRLGYSVEQMGEVRLAEMREVARVLGLATMLVPDLPDGGLDRLSPQSVAKPIRDSLRRVRPHVVVTYPVHGISGHPDHLVTHAVVKHVFCELRTREHPWLQRLAFWTLPAAEAAAATAELAGAMPRPLSGTAPGRIGCVEPVEEEDLAAARAALDCYATYREMIEKSRIRERLGREVAFELFQEDPARPLADLTAGLDEDSE